jgi:N6-adenosine-specific RNA methylase IME4
MHGRKKKVTQLVVPKRKPAPPIKIAPLQRALEAAVEPADIKEIAAQLDAFESYMHDCGLYSIEDMRPINEARMRARWKLGRALKAVERTAGPGRGKVEKTLSGFTSFLKDLGLTKPTALEAQRIGAMPEDKLIKAFEQWRQRPDLLHYSDLLMIAKPYWHQELRRETHQRIKAQAEAAQAEAPERLGPFPLIYLDPPWLFDTHTPEMTHRMPDDHYPTMTDDEIVAERFFGRTISEMAAEIGVMLMWCTSSNMLRACAVMDRLGFTYKTNAVWDKQKIGTGKIFRNQHEMLLYGSRGEPPMPVTLYPSVFSGEKFERRTHSAKPDEVRLIIERMYPAFDQSTRVEIFARGQIPGWTCLGYEASASYRAA